MARTARLTETLGPMKTTPTQAERVRRESEERNLSLADVVRAAIDGRYGLTNGEPDSVPPEG